MGEAPSPQVDHTPQPADVGLHLGFSRQASEQRLCEQGGGPMVVGIKAIHAGPTLHKHPVQEPATPKDGIHGCRNQGMRVGVVLCPTLLDSLVGFVPPTPSDVGLKVLVPGGKLHRGTQLGLCRRSLLAP